MSKCEVDRANPEQVPRTYAARLYIDANNSMVAIDEVIARLRLGRRLAGTEQFDLAHAQAHLMVGGDRIARFLCAGPVAPAPVPASVPFGNPGRLHS